MSKSIIEVIGLSKKYKIFHQGGYFTFRDSFAKYIKNPLSFISDKKSHFSVHSHLV